ncbi:UDP-N-acetylglucosamine--LPS N-acetylglucosamine transferase [Clostridium bovifaecis]|uniref:UDP-N-acetylglucosamine--LPS N-acetylglucosamine transferase n=1 Tax=Clostridium bovifaecis TaxID=2184719 RepID=A0A6I6F029_9CLOT|nr:UDP-N-acetylglucosamine--LPS N-acetylglucosamine transferase [Clostridium bovifaecis]
MRTLIFSISAGEGHHQTSLAMKKYILANDNSSEVMIVDTLTYISPLLNKIVIGSYLKAVQIKPSLYRKLYYVIDSSNKLSSFQLSSKFNNLLCIKLKKLIDDFKPDTILSTHPIPTEMLSILKIKCGLDVPIITIITDYAPHNFWLHSGIDAYITANQGLIEDIAEKGMDKSKVYDFGIPINPDFLQKYDRIQTLSSLNLSPNKLTFLVMGGSLGMGKILDLCKELDKIDNDFQLIVITGKNTRLYSQLIKLKPSFSKDIKVLKYTKEINKYMQACDLLFTKPGGITITEAMLSSIPLVLFSPIPGQEEKNIEFLTKRNLAIYLDNIKGCSSIIEDLLMNSFVLQKIKHNYANYIKPRSGNDIYNLMYCLSQNNILKEMQNAKVQKN